MTKCQETFVKGEAKYCSIQYIIDDTVQLDLYHKSLAHCKLQRPVESDCCKKWYGMLNHCDKRQINMIIKAIKHLGILFYPPMTINSLH